MTCEADILMWKWGAPGCRIVVRAGVVTVWSGCTIADPPTEAEYAAAAAEYAAAQALETPLSKLALRRALRARGLEADLDAILDVDPVAAADWADAHVLSLGDPLLQQMLPVFQARAGLTPADLAALIAEARAAEA